MPRIFCRYGRFILALIFVGSFSGNVTATVTVSPNSAALAEGGSNNAFPFGQVSQTSSFRYQQVFNAADFTSLPAGDLITQIVFRPDYLGGTIFSTVLPNVEIHLSTTSLAADNLLPAFASNIGADEILVFSGALPLFTSLRGPPEGPKGFDIVIALQQPFRYNPSLGNLLLDVKNFEMVATTAFDAVDVAGDSVSRLFTGEGGAVESPIGTLDSIGLVTRFISVPEPCIFMQLVGLAFGFCRFRRQRRGSCRC